MAGGSASSLCSEQPLQRGLEVFVYALEIEAAHIVAVEQAALDGGRTDRGLDRQGEVEGLNVIAEGLGRFAGLPHTGPNP